MLRKHGLSPSQAHRLAGNIAEALEHGLMKTWGSNTLEEMRLKLRPDHN